MFKRVERRQKKKREEDELGLDEEMKEILGMQDTDSDESESDSDLDDSSEDGGDGVRGRQGTGRKRKIGVSFEDSGGENDENGDEDEEDIESEEDDSAVVDEPPIAVREALRSPVYVISIQPDVKACIVCPGKLLKASQMVDIHIRSHAHLRRLKQFAALAKDANPESNAWDIVPRKKTIEPLPSRGSKRAEKKEAKQVLLKAKREKRKAQAKAKNASTSSETTIVKPAKKKQRIDHPDSGHPAQLPSPTKIGKEGALPSSNRTPSAEIVSQPESVRPQKQRAKAKATATVKAAYLGRGKRMNRDQGSAKQRRRRDDSALKIRG